MFYFSDVCAKNVITCKKRKIEHFVGNIYSSKFYFLSTFAPDLK